MRAQSLRKTIGIGNVVLGLAVLAGGGWYLTRVKPALAAAPASADWVSKAWKQYDEDKRNVTPAKPYPLKSPEELDVILRPDLWKDCGVWAYVGPVPTPMAKKDTGPAAAPPQPEGIDALGKPFTVWWKPNPGVSSLAWKLTSGKTAYLREGQWLNDAAKPEVPGRFKIIDIEMPDPDVLSFTVVYEVYDDPTKPPKETKKGGPYDLSRKGSSTFVVEPVAGPPGTAATTAPATGAPPVAPGAPGTAAIPVVVPAADDRPPPIKVAWTQNTGAVEFEKDQYEWFQKHSFEDVVGDVASENVEGGKGVRITKLGTKSVAGGFEIQQGDIVVSIQDQPVKSRDQAIQIVKGLPKDVANVKVVIERNGAQVIYNIDPRHPDIRGASRARFGNGK